MYEEKPFIFLIDDDEDDLEMMVSSLEPHGVSTRTFNSGPGALACFDRPALFKEMPSLIILDYNMPLMNGMETLTKIKSRASIRHIPVVIYSTTINALFARTARENGVFACMTKAISLSDFDEHVACFAAMAHSFLEKHSHCREYA
ncbi:MAG TPA: response regulator [Chitinophagaceae bacterium]|nr:response regulator [Chitinophagaceae bacterium]